MIFERRRAGGRSGAPWGFSLFELLVALAVMALLMTLAYPTYVAYKVRGNRAATQAMLVDLANRQQLYLLDARMYSATLAELGAAPVPSIVSDYYVVPDPIVDNEAAPPTFIVSASARPGTVQARDGDLSINSAGVRAGHW